MIVSEVCGLAPLRNVNLDSGSLVAALEEIINGNQNPATRKTLLKENVHSKLGRLRNRRAEE